MNGKLAFMADACSGGGQTDSVGNVLIWISAWSKVLHLMDSMWPSNSFLPETRELNILPAGIKSHVGLDLCLSIRQFPLLKIICVRQGRH